MSYPIKDKTKAAKIKADFEKEINDIETNKKTYKTEIGKLRKKPIPSGLQSKLIDDRFGKEHAFEKMPCNHKTNNRLDMANCKRCQYNKREIECENLIDSLNGNETTMSKGRGPAVEMSLTKLVIVRGRLDDVVGFSWSWA